MRCGYALRAINALCYSKPWQKAAIVSDYQIGQVDTKLPEALLDTFFKYNRRCVVKVVSIALS